MVSLQSTTNKQMTKCLAHEVAVSDLEPMASMATQSLIQKRLEENFGVDFSKYEQYKNESKTS